MSRDDIVQAGSGGPDFTPKDWPTSAPERPDHRTGSFIDDSPIIRPAPERPDTSLDRFEAVVAYLRAFKETLHLTSREATDLAAGIFDIVEPLAAAPVTDAGLRDALTDEAMRDILMVQPPPENFAAYSAAVRDRIVAALSRQATS